MVMNKKGFIIELIAFAVIGIIVILFFGGIIYGFDLFTDVITDPLIVDSSELNLTAATNPTIGSLNTGLSNLHLIAAVIIIGYLFATLIFAYFSSKHPLWLIVYILVVIMVVIFSIYISNAYETVQSNSLIGGMVSEFSIGNVIMSYLPVWTALIGLFGIALSIIGMTMARRMLE